MATLVEDYKQALTILEQVPPDSIILFPEAVSLISTVVKRYSEDKNLCIIYNSDMEINKKIYIAMRAFDNGKHIWDVRKFKLWHTDLKQGLTPSKPEPYVTIRGIRTGVFICYDATDIFKMIKELQESQIKILMIPSNWEFNFELIQRIIDFSLKYIPTLEACIFSNTNTMSIIQTKSTRKIIRTTGHEILNLSI